MTNATCPSASPVAALNEVNDEIKRACHDAGRDPATVILIAVSKTFAAETIAPVIVAGQHVFGENRVQEAKAKWPPLMERHPGLELHMIGPLQSNKARDAVELFDFIHTLDRMSLASEIAKAIARSDGRRSPRILVEVNTGAESQKAGVLPEEVDAFVAAVKAEHGIVVDGLMCIPPVDEAPAPHFALTAKIAARNGLKLLSMGMSADFVTAIHFGATHVRVGSAIFGDRPAKPGD
jgi:PLP dependent protein